MTAPPPKLQLSFVVEREVFAWWGTDDPARSVAALGIDGILVEDLTLAVPDPTSGSVVPARLPAVLSSPAMTVVRLAATAPAPGWSDSVLGWQRIVRRFQEGAVGDGLGHGEFEAMLPVAGHAPLCGDGITIWSAHATIIAAARAAGPGQGEQGPPWPLLRPYQRAGARWLLSTSRDHGGGILADDMGLGKTIQVLALLAGRHGPHLVVCPTSVLGNWAREIDRFTPQLATVVHASGERVDLRAAVDGATPTVVLTTYGLLRADAELARIDCDAVVLDEAQYIKNPATRTAGAARALSARTRIAVTGTPVENRLDELWSLFAFTNPEVLGPRARFRRRFATAIETQHSSAAARRLHELVAPFLLRRRKSEVAEELPPRIDVAHTVAMTGEQERLYRHAVDDAFDRGLGDGIARRGRVLALITRLKQICNHPQLVAAGPARLAARSGKLDRLVEVLGEVVAGDERALIFTQYRATATLLADHLAEQVTGMSVPVLHGGLTRAARERLVESFSGASGPPLLVLSLRAAGTGLNLTRASHVLHYDRWWNPAVEAQASDRAHRIGQTRTVTVHTLTTLRTLEELIATLHVGKRELTDVAVGSAAGVENNLARLGDDDLRAVLDPSSGTAR